jgi:hypothetical protein
MAASHWSDATKEAMGGSHDKPAKEISHVEVRKSGTKGDHIITHHHTHPEHHPAETKTTRGDDEMVEHMMQNMGSQNPGEAAADPNAAAAPDPNAGSAPAGPAAGTPPPAMGGQ